MALLPQSESADPLRVLVVEDDELILQVITLALRREGYDVHACANGEQAIGALATCKPDIILSDVRMPVCDGFQLLQEVRRNPVLSHVPFIIISARAETADQRMGMSLGADDYLTKPFEMGDLLKTMSVRLERSAFIRRIREEQCRFLSRIIPHELRTPLVAVIGYGDLLSHAGRAGEVLAPADLRRYGEDLLLSGRRLLRLSDNLALWAWLENRNAGSHPHAAIDLVPQLLQSERLRLLCSECESHQGREGDLQFDFETARIRALREGFQTVLQILVENAFKFSLPGSPVRVSGRSNGTAFLVNVVDRGRGMTASQIESISPLRQFNRDLFEQQGMGLGLSIARRYAQLSGGELRLASNPDGVGLAVSLVLPLG